MAQTLQQVYDELLAYKESQAELAGLTSPSATAIWRLLLRIQAFCAWTNQQLFAAHKAEVAAIIDALKPHRLKWYNDRAKAFQYGDTLPYDSDEYAVVDEAAKIVKQAATIELATGQLRVKVYGASSALTDAQMIAFRAYMNRVKDAGIRLLCTSNAPDDFRLALQIDYDPLVLNASGERIDGTDDEPVLNAVKAFCKALPFNGLIILNRLIDAVERVEGVVICRIAYAESRHGELSYEEVVKEFIPDAGVVTIDETYFNDEVTYTAHSLV